ncbi:hypothetical protein [Aquimarina rhabdastrellae]
MKKRNLSIKVILAALFITACQSDNDTQVEEELSTEEIREQTIETLTAGNSKTWYVVDAKLHNGNETLNLTGNYNVIDDEFVFSETDNDEIALVWNRGYDIKTDASTVKETFSDSYISKKETILTYQDENSTILASNVEGIEIDVVNTTTANIRINTESGGSLIFVLNQKLLEHYSSPPSSELHFTEAFTIYASSIGDPGMRGSYQENSIYIGIRENEINDPNNYFSEKIIKHNLDNNNQIERVSRSGFSTKQLHIIDDKLYVVAGFDVNTYELDIIEEPIYVPHNKVFSRFGTAYIDNTIYIIGGDFNYREQSNKIYKWDIETETLIEFATLPEKRFGARGTIINNYLYVFGGREVFSLNTPEKNTVYKIDLNNPTNIETFYMDRGIRHTFVQRLNNLIYVAGQSQNYNNDGNIISRDFVIGVYNTLDNSYRELETDIENNSGYKTIHQMKILDNKMYILYSDNDLLRNNAEFKEWDILVSDLN